MNNYYFDADKFKADLTLWREQQNKAALNRVGLQAVELVKRYLTKANFRRYQTEIKEEMTSHAYSRVNNAIEKVDYTRSPRDIFNYFTRTTHIAFIEVLGKYYKNLRRKHEYQRYILKGQGFTDQQIAKILGGEELEEQE